MKFAIVAAALLPFIAAPALAESSKALAEAVLPSKTRLKVSSSAFADHGRIPQDVSAYGRNVSPALSWSGAPAGTRSFVVVAEDPDAPGPKPFEHWVVYNIPGEARGVPAGGLPAGAVAGRNSTGKTGYWGPHPPAGGDHHYHFEVFALDRPLNLRRDGGREEVLAAMRGHVLAEGETVGLFRKP
jgi:Raf kinase inhibitor-like YbhB/YbcL family protein